MHHFSEKLKSINKIYYIILTLMSGANCAQCTWWSTWTRDRLSWQRYFPKNVLHLNCLSNQAHFLLWRAHNGVGRCGGRAHEHTTTPPPPHYPNRLSSRGSPPTWKLQTPPQTQTRTRLGRSAKRRAEAEGWFFFRSILLTSFHEQNYQHLWLLLRWIYIIFDIV